MPSLCVLLSAGSVIAQAVHTNGGVPVRVTDVRGVPIWQAHVYTREVLPTPDDTMHSVGETNRNGVLMLPSSGFARDVLVFDFGFQPWVGVVRGSSTQALAVHMRKASCGSPDTECHNDWDVFGPPARSRRR